MAITIKLIGGDGEVYEFAAFSLVRQVAVSTERKEYDGGVGLSAFVSHSASVPDGYALAAEDELRALVDALAAAVAQAVDEQLAARKAQFPNHVAPQAPAPAQIAVAPGEGRQLQYAPKAEDRRPGDTWSTVCTEYELTAKELQLWTPIGDDGSPKQDRQYPEAVIPRFMDRDRTKPHPCWHEKWIERMDADGQRQQFGKPVRATFRVVDRRNTKGLYYVNVVSLDVA